MKRSPLRTPQSELPIKNEPFALTAESATDGDRLTQQRRQSAADRASSETDQLSLLTPPLKQT